MQARTMVVLVALLFAVQAAPASAQPAEIVRDAVTASVNSPSTFFFGTLPVELDGALYFFADDGVHGRELWRTDGTEAGTWMVRDVCPGQCTGVSWLEIVPHQGDLFFTAHDGVHGRELWHSDGTFEGTGLVADVRPGPASSGPDWLTPFGDRLLFSAHGPDGRELWATDGTPAGTTQLLDIHPTGSSQPASFVVWNGAAWFTAEDNAHGRELWATDGTPGGTQLVADVRLGPADGLRSDQAFITRFHTPAPSAGLLLFKADDGIHGWELWGTDGTAAGTALVADIEPGSGASDPTWLTPFNGDLFFQAEQAPHGRSLWKTDGTAAGTALVQSFDPPFGSSLFPFVEAGGNLFFAASTDAEGHELWVTDGTPAGTERVEDLQAGPGGALAWNFAFGLHALGDQLLFQADDGVHGGEPWVSDGTPGGTHMLADLNPGAGSAFEIFFAPLLAGTTLDGQAYFFAFDPDAGWELRTTGGEPGNVTLVKDVHDQASAIPATPFFRYTETVDRAGTLFYLAADPDHGSELWASDGTEAGTRLVRDLDPGPAGGFPTWLTALGDLLFFEGPGDGNDRWLWVSDGTEGGTVPIDGAAARPLDPFPLARFGDRVFFGAEVEGGGRSLWVSDGTAPGTHPFPEGSPLPAPWGWDIAVAGGRLFVGAAGELWVTTGEAATSEKLADVEARDLVPAGPLLFFSGDDGSTGPELWVSDGTPGGTGPVLDLVPGLEGAVEPGTGFDLPLPDGPSIAGVSSPPAAYFAADDGVHGRELWWSDGTEAGTRFLGDLRPGPLGAEPRYLTVIRGIAYFVADDGVHGAELWRSDGTEVGTHLLADLEPGPGSSVPDSLTAVYGELFFSAWRADDGRELWRSDGTEAGTVRLQDIHAGPGSSSPGYFATSGDRLFFTASDGVRGFELWSLPGAAPALAGTKTIAGGDLRAGGRVVYGIALENPGDFALHDNPGDELVDEMPAGLTVLSAQADAGETSVDPDGRTVRWNGAVPAGGTVEITIEAAIALEAAGKLLANQAQLAYDGDGTGDNETLALTDDPSAGGPEDATEFVARAQVLQIPTLGPLALALLALLLATLGLGLTRAG